MKFQIKKSPIILASDIMKIRLTIVLSLVITILFGGCSKNEDPIPEPKNKETSILLYAVASNNLSYYFQEDLSELKQGLKKCDLSVVDFYVYSISKSSDEVPTLSKAVRSNSGDIVFEVIKKYDRQLASTDKERISLVIDDYRNLVETPVKGLIMWSHATAWSPAPKASRSARISSYADSVYSNSIVNTDFDNEGGGTGELSQITQQPSLWWGQDIDNGTYNYCNLGDLGEAIPDSYFNFIWFDCCYMSSVEVIYELRHKAERFVAYPTEVNAEGAPYDIITPFIACQNPDLVAAAEAMSTYYKSGNKVFTIAVIDPSAIEEVAEYSSAVANYTPAESYDLLIYSRSGLYFYDFVQFMKSKADSDISGWDEGKFDRAIENLIVYKNCGTRLFTGLPLDKSNYSGISSGYIVNADEITESSDYAMHYYQTLEWYKRVYLPWQK